MKKMINLTLLFVVALSLSFIPITSVRASQKVTLTYYAGKGYFKAKTNQNKRKISIKKMLSFPPQPFILRFPERSLHLPGPDLPYLRPLICFRHHGPWQYLPRGYRIPDRYS